MGILGNCDRRWPGDFHARALGQAHPFSCSAGAGDGEIPGGGQRQAERDAIPLYRALTVENPVLRRQLGVFKRKRTRPVLTSWDSLFRIGLLQLWADERDALVIVQPETVVRWQRERFRRFWARLP